MWERFLYGAPIFAPLLFPNLAALALIGISALSLRSGAKSISALLPSRA